MGESGRVEVAKDNEAAGMTVRLMARPRSSREARSGLRLALRRGVGGGAKREVGKVGDLWVGEKMDGALGGSEGEGEGDEAAVTSDGRCMVGMVEGRVCGSRCLEGWDGRKQLGATVTVACWAA